ncbi:MAG: DUF362 domain-containing protein [SAR202 cluster bacterium]|nr:DUF362 domain-containing protein [SAR202 cluster bacterium]
MKKNLRTCARCGLKSNLEDEAVANVGLVKSSDHYAAVRSALDLIKDDVTIPADLPVLVKPNMVSSDISLTATPVDAVRATLDFLQDLGVKKFIVGEGSAETADTMGGFERFGYLPLQDSYDIEFRDLNKDEPVELEALDANYEPITIRLAKSYFTSYVVSVSRMKTHNNAVVTLSIKNCAIGSILNPDRSTVSHDPGPINLSLVRLNRAAPPQLAVIDGVVGMEGNGPVDGTAISSGVALAGTNSIAVDRVGAEVMGFDTRSIGYLTYLSQMTGLTRDDINVIGEDPTQCVTRFKAHDDVLWQFGWWIKDWESYVDKSAVLDPAFRPDLSATPAD